MPMPSDASAVKSSASKPARRAAKPAASGSGGNVWVIVPTYNESENVGPITDAILATIPDAHILIVDDGSPDGTGALADELAAKNPGIAVLHRESKQGLGRAYVAAFHDVLARDAGVVVQIDADFSHPVRFLPALLEPLATGRADLVLGSRYVKGGHIPRWNILRRLVSRGGSIFAGVVLLMPYRDLTGGYKAFRTDVLRAIDIDRLHAGGYAFQIETTFLSRLAGARILEVPITFEERRAGQSKMSMAIFMEAFRLVLALRLKNLRRRRRSLPETAA
jgi:dolichol-phosphate mannosyltransferase